MRASARVALVLLIIAAGGLAGCGSLDKLSDTTGQGLASSENPTARMTPAEETSEFRQRRGHPGHRQLTRRQRRRTNRRKSCNASGRPRVPRSGRHPRAPRRRSRKRPSRNRYLLRVSRCNIHGRPHRQPELSHSKAACATVRDRPSQAQLTGSARRVFHVHKISRSASPSGL